MRKKLIFVGGVLSVLSAQSLACEQLYARVGAGYKLDEENKFIINGKTYIRRDTDPISARFELGCRRGRWTVGLSHDSQWGTGWPVNDSGEPYKTEVFIDYEWSWDL